jgi:hypothetical protein
MKPKKSSGGRSAYAPTLALHPSILLVLTAAILVLVAICIIRSAMAAAVAGPILALLLAVCVMSWIERRFPGLLRRVVPFLGKLRQPK